MIRALVVASRIDGNSSERAAVLSGSQTSGHEPFTSRPMSTEIPPATNAASTTSRSTVSRREIKADAITARASRASPSSANSQSPSSPRGTAATNDLSARSNPVGGSARTDKHARPIAAPSNRSTSVARRARGSSVDEANHLRRRPMLAPELMWQGTTTNRSLGASGAETTKPPPQQWFRPERVRRIELPCAAWEAAVLPLNYTRRAAHCSGGAVVVTSGVPGRRATVTTR